MRVFFFGNYDWANTRHKWCRALRALGVDSEIGVLRQHPYGYDETVISLASMAEKLRALGRGDVAFYTGCGTELGLIEGLIRNQVAPEVLRVTSVSGSFHRSAAQQHRRTFWPFANKCVRWHGRLFQFYVCLPDLVSAWPLSPKAIMLHGVEETPQMTHGTRFAYHCPSRRENKGTVTIETVPGIDILPRASWQEYQRTRREYRICIDQIAPHIGGLGANAEEALALGQVVIADVHNCRWGDLAPPPILSAGNAEALRGWMKALESTPAFVEEQQRASLAYATNHLVTRAVGTRLKSILEEALS